MACARLLAYLMQGCLRSLSSAHHPPSVAIASKDACATEKNRRKQGCLRSLSSAHHPPSVAIASKDACATEKNRRKQGCLRSLSSAHHPPSVAIASKDACATKKATAFGRRSVACISLIAIPNTSNSKLSRVLAINSRKNKKYFWRKY